MIKKIKNPDIEKSKFLIIPTPFEDEIFSSWLVRCAYAHKTYPSTFIHLHFPKNKNIYTLSTNIDATISNDILFSLSWKTNINFEELYQLTLKSYSGYLQENVIPNGHNKCLSLMRYCPKCFLEDKIPYFRKSWRSVFTTFCKKHNCYLQDKCFRCKSKINHIHMFKNKYTYLFCNKCGFNLSKSKVRFIENELDIELYQSNCDLLNILEKGYKEILDKVVYSFLFFDVILQLSKIILTMKNTEFKKKKYTKIIKEYKKMNFSYGKEIFNQMNIEKQYVIFGLCKSLFEYYPNDLRDFIYRNKLEYWHMIKDMKYSSYWYTTLINDIKNYTIYCAKLISEDELLSAITYLKKRDVLVNQKSLTDLMNCNFFSSYNQLKEKMKKLK